MRLRENLCQIEQKEGKYFSGNKVIGAMGEKSLVKTQSTEAYALH